MKSQFETLLAILDRIRAQAPPHLRAAYLPPAHNEDRVKQARSRAFIHLYLLVKHGLLDFEDREAFICDGPEDGGLDAYYIDSETKTRTLIQSKFHLTGRNFEVSQMSVDDLAKVEVDRILGGEKRTSDNKLYNAKVRKFQRELKLTKGIYKTQVVLLANVPHNDYKIRKAIGDEHYEIFDFNRSYIELVFPYCSGTFFVPHQVEINIFLPNKISAALDQYIKTEYGETQIMILFAPAMEIGRLLGTYKNAILQYNPRNYLSLIGSPVNREIRKSITNLDTNDFAILNNGLTISADSATLDPHTGDKKRGRLIMINPQIINGGQTAYTLSDVYENELPKNPRVFGRKEVMLKIICPRRKLPKRSKFIEMISNSTNSQNRVDEADRRSNDPILVEIQQRVFKELGYFFERKEGEFYDGRNVQHVLNRDYVIDRMELVKAYTAFCGTPSMTRSKGERSFFNEKYIHKLFPDSGVFANAFFAYKIYRRVIEVERTFRRRNYGKGKYGFALRYGKYAIVAAVGISKCWGLTGREDLDGMAADEVDNVLPLWRKFERYAKTSAKAAGAFLGGAEGFDNYYKGATMDSDIKAFFGVKP